MIDFGFGVTLHAIEEVHLAQLLMWRNDPRIYRWCRQRGLITWEQHSAWYKRQATDPEMKMYLIKSKHPNIAETAIGVCGLTSIDQQNGRAEFSLYIGPEFQRQGFARGSLKTLLTHAFRDLMLWVVWGESFDHNPAQTMFLDLGMVKEGTRRQFYFKNGRHIDAHLYSMTEKEWRDAKWNSSPSH
jgi:RimJ/RimL family protein N-acetyltransferase